MRLLGTEVTPVTSGTATLKDATTEAIRDWVTNVGETHYIIGTAAGPHPYPALVRDLQACIGEEVKGQFKEMGEPLPDYLLACVGGGSNAIGLFYPFKDYPQVKKFGVEAAGKGLSTGQHAASLTQGEPGVLHGSYSYLLQDGDGQVIPAYSISAGLDYPSVGPEHAFFKDAGIVSYAAVTDDEALAAFQLLSQTEGIIPAMESSHALAYLETLMPKTKQEEKVVVCLSGRGDKDVQMVSQRLGGLSCHA
jgi:tryptophan synthase beta chain